MNPFVEGISNLQQLRLEQLPVRRKLVDLFNKFYKKQLKNRAKHAQKITDFAPFYRALFIVITWTNDPSYFSLTLILNFSKDSNTKESFSAF